MRILHVDRLRGWGGRGNRTLQVLRGLRQRGLEVAYATQLGGAAAEHAGAAGIETLEFGMRGARLYTSAISLARIAKERRFDVVHCHASRDQSVGLLLKATGAHPALVRTCHNPPRLRSGRLSRLQYAPVDAFIAVSHFVERSATEAGLPATKVQTIHDAVDLTEFRPRTEDEGRLPAGFRSDCLRIGHVSRLAPQKGVEPLLRATARLLRAGVSKLQCILVGGGEAQWRPLVSELGIDDHVLFTGHRDDVPDLVRWFDVFVLVPIGEEALGTVYIEALASGVPVVGSDIGGVSEVVDDTVGALLPPNDTDALVLALNALANSPEKRASLGSAARTRAVCAFGLDRMVDETLEIYRRLVRNRPP